MRSRLGKLKGKTKSTSMRNLLFALVGATAAIALIPSLAIAHSGRTNASGCHNDNVNGGYHCHGGSSTPSPSAPNRPPTPSNTRPSTSPQPSSGTGLNSPGNIINLPGQGRTSSPTTPSAPVAGTTYQVVSVGDGDTLRIRQGNNTITVRLACIDAPEMGQAPHGAASRDRLQQLIPAGTAVSLRTVDVDRYGRTVAEVFRGQTNLNLAMVQEGRAAVYRQYMSQCNQAQYLAAEAAARQRRLAFWSQPNPVMPWDFRRNN